MLSLVNSGVCRHAKASPGFDWPDDCRHCWRVSVDDRVLSMPFARKHDAELARIALESAGLGDANAIRAAGGPAVRMIMIEALAW